MMQQQSRSNNNNNNADYPMSNSQLDDQQQLLQQVPMEIDSQINLSEENETQMLRLIQQYLTDHGYQYEYIDIQFLFREIAQNLSQKSKVLMEDEVMNEFRSAVLVSSQQQNNQVVDFSRARALLKQLSGLKGNSDKMKQVEYQLYEQEYLELIERGLKLEAIHILQRELMPRTDSESQRSKLHQLAQLIMYDPASQDLPQLATWKGSGVDGRRDLLERLQALMPPSEMLPPHRLEQLVKQSLAYQIYNCKYHNVAMTTGGGSQSFSLLEDHQCQKQMMIPTKCIGVLSKHKDEVWQVKFSASGHRLATIGKDNILYLWSITKITLKSKQQQKYRIKCTHDIRGHSKQVNALNWSTSTEDKWIVTASHDNTAKVWDTRTGRNVMEIKRHQEAVTATAFVNDNRLITAAVDKLVILWEMRPQGDSMFEAVEIARVETRNYLDIAVSAGRFIAMGQTHFQVFNGPDFRACMEEQDLNYEVETSDIVTSIALSKDGRYLLANVSLKQPRLELFDLGNPSGSPRRAELIRRYRGGHEQTQFVLRCAFGGANESFVLCGSEDATVSIWNKDKGDIVAKIGGGQDMAGGYGHNQVINSVSWSPADPKIFATASDDQTVRIWGVETMNMCEVITDSKELKRVDLSKSNGMQNGHAYNQEEDEHDDDDDDEDSDDYDREEEDEAGDDEEEMEEVHPRQRISSRSGIREEEEGEGDDDDDEEEEEDWVEGGGGSS